MIRAVYFDIGETILDRSREYAAWARLFDVPAHTFSAVFGAYVARGRSVRDVIDFFATNQGRDESFEELRNEITVPALDESDLYPDVRATLAALKAAGLHVGIAGNQPSGLGDEVRALGLAADVTVTSHEWRVAKPSPDFFAHVVASADVPADQIVYVGDQLDNDVLPALDAGLVAVRILRGPWGLLVRDGRAENRCLAVIRELRELPALLGL